MSGERHLDFEQRIDRSLAGVGTAEDERALAGACGFVCGVCDVFEREPEGGCGVERVFVWGGGWVECAGDGGGAALGRRSWRRGGGG